MELFFGVFNFKAKSTASVINHVALTVKKNNNGKMGK